MPIPQLTVFLVETEVVSEIKVATEAFVVYFPLILRSLSMTSPLNLMELPWERVKSFLAMFIALKWKLPEARV